MRSCAKCGKQTGDAQALCPQCESRSRTCPSGKHTMEPGWAECVYCKQQSPAARQSAPPPARFATVVENQMPPRANPGRPVMFKDDTHLQARSVRPINAPLPATPHPGTAHSGRPRAHTEFRSIPNLASETPPASRDRKIVGLLVSYTWSPEGKIYPIREGRNFIGRESDCEVCVPEDTTLSAHHSHITFRQQFVVGDMVSMTGTDVDGVPIEEQFRSLTNYATIRAGSTYFTFMTIPTPSPAAAPRP